MSKLDCGTDRDIEFVRISPQKKELLAVLLTVQLNICY